MLEKTGSTDVFRVELLVCSWVLTGSTEWIRDFKHNSYSVSYVSIDNIPQNLFGIVLQKAGSTDFGSNRTDGL